MSLRAQTTLALAVLLALTISVLYAVLQPRLLGTFSRLETSEVRAHVGRVLDALSAEIGSIASTAKDWAAWDDTYAYAAGELTSFVSENISVPVLVNLRMDFVALVDRSGRLLFGAVADAETGELRPVPEGLMDIAEPGVDRAGMVRLSDGRLVLIAMHTILTSQQTGPDRGELLFGRFLTAEELGRLAEQVHLQVTLRQLDDAQIDVVVLDRLLGRDRTAEGIVVYPTSGDAITGYALLRDLGGTPVAAVAVETTRDTYQAGQAALRSLGEMTVGIIAAAAALFLLLLHTRILGRLSGLAASVLAITARGGPGGRVPLSGRDEIGRLAGAMNGMLDSLEESRSQLERSEKRYRDLFEYSRDAIYITTPEGEFVDVNQACVDLLGCPREELLASGVGRFYRDPEARDRFKATISAAGFVVDYPVELRRCDGTELDCLLTTVVQRGPEGELAAYQGIIRDVTQIKRQQDELAHLATHDPLTGLLNRSALDERLALELQRAERNLERCAVLYLDLDHFKEINDRYGHAAGDEILREAAGRLRTVLRKSDAVARFGGDEFVLVIPDLEGPDGDAEVASKILRTLDPVFTSSAQNFRLSASIGIAVYPEDGSDARTLLRRADAAMYVAKQQGRNAWRRHTGGASS